MLEIAKACYLEEVLFGKKDAAIRDDISSLIEQASRASADELIQMVNTQIGQ